MAAVGSGDQAARAATRAAVPAQCRAARAWHDRARRRALGRASSWGTLACAGRRSLAIHRGGRGRAPELPAVPARYVYVPAPLARLTSSDRDATPDCCVWSAFCFRRAGPVPEVRGDVWGHELLNTRLP